MGDLLGSPREKVSHGYETLLGESSTMMGDLLGSPRERVSYLAYPNLFGIRGLEEEECLVQHYHNLHRYSEFSVCEPLTFIESL